MNANTTRIKCIENEYNAILNSFLEFEFYYTAKLFRYKKSITISQKNSLHERFDAIEKQVFFGLKQGRECGQVIFDTSEEEEENAKFQNEVIYDALINDAFFLDEEIEKILNNLKNSIIKKLSKLKDDCIKNYKKLTLSRYCTKYTNTDYNEQVYDLCKDFLRDYQLLDNDAEDKLYFLYETRKKDDKTILIDKISIIEKINSYEEDYDEDFFDC